MSIGIQKNNEKGAVIVLVAIMLLLIVTCLGIVVDLGHIHNVKVQLQEAVDAAALAGAGQLNGASGMIQRVKDVAVATAKANGATEVSFVDSECKSSATDSCLGTWNDTALGSSAADRWTYNGTSPNAVLVRATRAVKHIFFFFSAATTVTADAIAVAKPEVPVLPLAIVTCIPSDKMLENPGALPGADVCDIRSYSFNPDQNDTAAWTSLTFNASDTEIIDYMSSQTGRDKFNKVIFGTGIPNDGIENEAPTTTGNCDPSDLNISCGLGKIAGKELAPPGDFPVPPGLPPVSATPGQPAGSFDPLVGFAQNGALPRWYNVDDDGVFGSDDYFSRVWSQDGILIKGASESLTDYLARIKSYAVCTTASCKPYGDNRFLASNTDPLIVKPTGKFAQNLKDTLGFIPEYWPKFVNVVAKAGYPKVGVMNGSATNILQAFVGNPDVSNGTDLRCSDNDPFPPGQKTLRVNAPVIFAGSCEDWKALSNGGHTLDYIGLSKFLLTRVWTNKNDYDCGTESEVVQLPASGASCTASSFVPGLFNDQYFSLPVTVKGGFKGLEGLTLVPVADDEKDQGSILKVYLVE